MLSLRPLQRDPAHHRGEDDLVTMEDVRGQTRAHSVIRAATRQDRCVNAGDRRQNSYASMTKPRPQKTSATLGS